jgi:hypothetical protein
MPILSSYVALGAAFGRGGVYVFSISHPSTFDWVPVTEYRCPRCGCVFGTRTGAEVPEMPPGGYRPGLGDFVSKSRRSSTTR